MQPACAPVISTLAVEVLCRGACFGQDITRNILDDVCLTVLPWRLHAAVQRSCAQLMHHNDTDKNHPLHGNISWNTLGVAQIQHLGM